MTDYLFNLALYGGVILVALGLVIVGLVVKYKKDFPPNTWKRFWKERF